MSIRFAIYFMSLIYDPGRGDRKTEHSQAHGRVIAGIVVTSRLPAMGERINPAKRNEFRTCLSSLEYSEACNLFADNSPMWRVLRFAKGDRPSRAFTVRAIRKHPDAPMAIGHRPVVGKLGPLAPI
jgi:hypothetical protein